MSGVEQGPRPLAAVLDRLADRIEAGAAVRPAVYKAMRELGLDATEASALLMGGALSPSELLADRLPEAVAENLRTFERIGETVGGLRYAAANERSLQRDAPQEDLAAL